MGAESDRSAGSLHPGDLRLLGLRALGAGGGIRCLAPADAPREWAVAAEPGSPDRRRSDDGGSVGARARAANDGVPSAVARVDRSDKMVTRRVWSRGDLAARGRGSGLRGLRNRSGESGGIRVEYRRMKGTAAKDCTGGLLYGQPSECRMR